MWPTVLFHTMPRSKPVIVTLRSVGWLWPMTSKPSVNTSRVPHVAVAGPEAYSLICAFMPPMADARPTTNAASPSPT